MIVTATASVIATIPVGLQPQGLAISPDAKQLYVANSNSNSVSVINTTTAPPSTVVMIPVGAGPFGAAVTPDGKHAYVTNQAPNTVTVIDFLVTTIPVGSNPTGVGIGSSPPCVPLLGFNPTLNVALGHLINTDTFTLKTSFTLSSGTPAINPVSAPVTIRIGPFAVTIPAGSFRRNDASYNFQGIIDGVSLKAQVTPAGALHYTFALTAQGASLGGLKNPAPVALTIGRVCGEAPVTAQITP